MESCVAHGSNNDLIHDCFSVSRQLIVFLLREDLGFMVETPSRGSAVRQRLAFIPRIWYFSKRGGFWIPFRALYCLLHVAFSLSPESGAISLDVELCCGSASSDVN